MEPLTNLEVKAIYHRARMDVIRARYLPDLHPDTHHKDIVNALYSKLGFWGGVGALLKSIMPGLKLGRTRVNYLREARWVLNKRRRMHHKDDSVHVPGDEVDEFDQVSGWWKAENVPFGNPVHRGAGHRHNKKNKGDAPGMAKRFKQF